MELSYIPNGHNTPAHQPMPCMGSRNLQMRVPPFSRRQEELWYHSKLHTPSYIGTHRGSYGDAIKARLLKFPRAKGPNHQDKGHSPPTICGAARNSLVA